MNRRIWQLLTTIAIPAVVMVIIAISQQGGYVHGESTAFIRVYNDYSRSLFEIIFDPLVTDWNAYQARELSYLIDAIDARFIYWCATLQMAHFYSLSAMIILLLCVVIQQFFLAEDFRKIPRWMAVLISVVFVSSESCRNYSFFRSSKPLTALAVTALCFGLWHLFMRGKLKKTAWLMVVIPVFLAPYVDRQGMFLTAVFSGIAGAVICALSFQSVRDFFAVTSQRMKDVCACGIIGALSLLTATLYNLYLAPLLIKKLNGYEPSFEYQNIGSGGVFNLQDGALFLLDNTGFSVLHIYGIAAFAGGLVLLAIWSFCWVDAVRKDAKKLPHAFFFFALFGAMLLCSNLMTFRHRLMLRDDVIHGVYFMPMLALILFLAAVTLEMIPVKWVKGCFATLLFLALLTLPLGISSAPADDHLKFFKITSPAVLRSMNDSRVDINSELLPYSSTKLIQHFRHTTGR